MVLRLARPPPPRWQGPHPPWPSQPRSLPGVPGLQGAIALQLLDQHLTAPPYHIPDFPQGAAALEGATAILDTETQAGATAEWHRPGSGVLQTSGQELDLAPNTLLPTCTEGLALAQSRLTAYHVAPPHPGSPGDMMTIEWRTPTTTAWLIQTHPPSGMQQTQHPARVLTGTRPPARMALASPQPCSNMA